MQYLFEDKTYKIIGCCMEVHKHLGKGFNEVVYKDALEIEFQDCGIPYNREFNYRIRYKEHLLERYYVADFVIYDQIILEAKAIESLTSSHVKQTMNYLAASNLKIALLINFGQDSLNYKRVILNK